MPNNNGFLVMLSFASCLFKSAVRDAVHDSCERKLAALKRETQARLMSAGDVDGGSMDEFSTRLIWSIESRCMQIFPMTVFNDSYKISNVYRTTGYSKACRGYVLIHKR